MIQLLNEPEHWDNAHDSLRSYFYPRAWDVR